MPMPMNRRQFVGVASAAVALALTATGCNSSANYAVAALARTDLVDALGADVVRAIGTRYREMMPDERSAGSLRAAIVASRPWTSHLPGSRQPAVAELVQSDFEHGHTVIVEGWILSATEARQCALYSLLAA